ncbi:hypothetical protein Dsin_023799 [Dipteronia sinensis]|uniref:non-specific serine/threonine protein kinase n=1 Tax=Dipteronia sinensis TaxID=43782 RepID=A0AAE0A5I7_9ROSI|nr:hypothetical protein Dsin_023799 [Dipteronia sinensis]
MSPFQLLFLTVFLVSGFSLSSSRSNNVSIPDDGHISLTRSPLEASCPLNFDSLRKLVHESPPRPVLTDMPSQCKGMFRAVLVLRAEYLRTNGYFLPPPDTTEACWQSFRSLISEFIKGFDIQTSCGDYPESMSETCYNITSQAEFESRIPAQKMQEIWNYCNQSLDTNSACDSCTSKLSSLGDYYSQVPGTGNVSVCTGYASMYAAAIVNHLGPTDRATMRCLFALSFPSKPSGFKPHKIIFWAVLSGSVILGILGAITAVWFCWTRSKKSEGKKLLVLVRYETSSEFGSGLYARGSNPVRFKFQEIKEATRNFSVENIIGKGAYGNVYKGIFPDGTEVAFKRFKNCSVACDASFKHEVEVIASIRHVNLVALRGYCTKTLPMEGHQRIIVCDLLHNGSLHDHLFTISGATTKLSWPIRLKIALGTARGLAYLHYGLQPAIIHRDIKASNILLDEEFEPQVADFGLAKFNYEGTTHLTTKVAGTLGYVAPEYVLYGKLSKKSDVYSFGVVLLELLSGKKAYQTIERKNVLLTDWAWGLVNEGRALDVIDQKIPEMLMPELMKQYVLIAALCVHPIVEARPTMDQIVKILETDFSINHKVPPGAYAASPSRDVIDFSSDSMKSSPTTDESNPSVMLIVE